MTEFNLPLLRKAVEWAESEAAKPRDESEWCQSYFAVDGEQISRTCGTAYCIAGWVIHEFAEGHHDISEFDIDGQGDAMIAQDLLGITDVEAWGHFNADDGLFSAGNTIKDIRRFAEEIARGHGEEL